MSPRNAPRPAAVYGVDIGKNIFHVVGLDSGGDGTVPAIILPTKQGDIYVLDRRTGELLFPVEEIDAPTGVVEPENLSPTQPVSTYADLRKPQLTEKDVRGATPLDQLWFRKAGYDGIYPPPTVDRHWIQYPGYNGGSTGAASRSIRNGTCWSPITTTCRTTIGY